MNNKRKDVKIFFELFFSFSASLRLRVKIFYSDSRVLLEAFAEEKASDGDGKEGDDGHWPGVT